MAAMAQVTVVAALAVPKMWARQVSKSMITMWTPSRPPSSPHGKACAHAWRAIVLQSADREHALKISGAPISPCVCPGIDAMQS